jgi:hypothetical protein
MLLRLVHKTIHKQTGVSLSPGMLEEIERLPVLPFEVNVLESTQRIPTGGPGA